MVKKDVRWYLWRGFLMNLFDQGDWRSNSENLRRIGQSGEALFFERSFGLNGTRGVLRDDCEIADDFRFFIRSSWWAGLFAAGGRGSFNGDLIGCERKRAGDECALQQKKTFDWGTNRFHTLNCGRLSKMKAMRSMSQPRSPTQTQLLYNPHYTQELLYWYFV